MQIDRSDLLMRSNTIFLVYHSIETAVFVANESVTKCKCKHEQEEEIQVLLFKKFNFSGRQMTYKGHVCIALIENFFSVSNDISK